MQHHLATRKSLPFFGAGLENAEMGRALVGEFSRVVTSGDLLNGPDVHRFEARIAERAGRAHCVAVNSATDALFFALRALGIGEGDCVLVPAFSFVASASAIVRAGAIPVFVDVVAPGLPDAAPCTMDLADAEACLTPRTCAIVWVGLFGGIADTAPVAAFAQRHGLTLVEDASQSFGAACGTVRAGTLGAASVFSFDRNKTLGAPGTGGAIVTDDADLCARLRALRYHGFVRGGFATLGYNSQMSSLTAAILNLKLEHHDMWVTRRNAIAARFDAALEGLPVQILRWPTCTTHVRHKYVLLAERRADLEAGLQAAGVPTRRHYQTPLPREPVFAGFAGPGASYPVAESLAERALSLPIHAQLSDADVDLICETIARTLT